MKKIYLWAIFLLLFTSSFNISFAQEISPTPITVKNNYELPYPGLLPDSPLYFLRIIRDRIVGFLISAPSKKAEFNLLQADKRLNAGVYLFNKKKFRESISIISKAENYFGESLQKTKEAKVQGMDTTEIVNKLVDSSKKHQEILKSLIEKSPPNLRNDFSSQLQRAIDFQKEAESFLLKSIIKPQ